VKKWLILSAMMMSLVACQQSSKTSSSKSVELKSDDDKVVYSMGVRFGGNVRMLNLSERELDILAMGFQDAAKSAKLKIEPKDFEAKVPQFARDRMGKVAEQEKKRGADFLEKFKKEKGTVATLSGLAYQVLKEGTGASPKAEDTVEVHYHGTLINGDVFDSSVDRDKKITFPLNRVIKGWTEGLQTMKEGGKSRFVIPSDLAYGDNGALPKIPGGATLIFDVELFKVTKADAAKTKK